ncbi:MAG TPA: ECF transporter S component [Candidatus Limiplasma sp.]|nr:ECF transporter S component [Candidatus Limiplasma sp.]HPS80240.1 ECF transporter S component [Candidatus Limiplasma sp.]
MPEKTHPQRKLSSTARLAICGMMAALIFVATYFIKLPMMMTNGYVHLGDGFILLSASMLGWAAVPAAAVGSMLADLMGGYAVYLLPTFIIKGAVAAIAVLAVRAKHEWMLVLGLVAAEAVMVGGYFLVEWLILGYGLAGASASLVGNCMQGLSGVVIGLLLIPLMKRVKL